MDPDIQKIYSTLEDRLFPEGSYVTPSFIEANNMLPPFQELGLESFLKPDEPICPKFVTEFYHSLEVKRSRDNYPYIEFKLGAFTFQLSLSQLSRIFKTPYRGSIFYTNDWSLDSLDTHFNNQFFGLDPERDFKKSSYGPMPYAMLLTRLFKHILSTNPQSTVPFDRFTYHERVIISLDISRKTIKDKGKRATTSSSSSSSSSNKEEDPSSLQFYEELSDDEELTDA
ncbi:hypothetical protein Tco_0492418 [Tanacetum coccineum]